MSDWTGVGTRTPTETPFAATTMRTWPDISRYVAEFHKRESQDPNPEFYRELGDEALEKIAEMAHPYRKSWDNSVIGALTIVGNAVALPVDYLDGPLTVFWNGVKLGRGSKKDWDIMLSGWRTQSGTPSAWCMEDASTLVFDCAPDESVGMLVVWGQAYLPPLSDDPDAVNPFALLPKGSQLLVAKYILARLPVVPIQAVNESREALIYATQVNSIRQGVRDTNAADFDKGLHTLLLSVRNRTQVPMRF